MNYKILSAILFILLLITGSLFLFSRKNNRELNYLKTVQSLTSGNLYLPIDQNNKAVSGVGLTYSFSGRIKDVQSKESGAKILLDTADSQIPEMIATKDTPIIKHDKNTVSETSFLDFKIGSFANVTMTYDLKNKSWSLQSITLDLVPK